jgi:D-sedoheptulose 7-phosphate isomerase
MTPPPGAVTVADLDHISSLSAALHRFAPQLATTDRWGTWLVARLLDGGRLLAVGNGGSAAQAQHLTAEIVGRYHSERRPFSAVALHSEPSALTAILNDYGPEEVFARQVEAHGRTGDVLVAMSTSGASRNVVVAAERAVALGVHTWALTGPAPNPLSKQCDECLAIDVPDTAVIQEIHLVAVHLVCAALDRAVGQMTVEGAA